MIGTTFLISLIGILPFKADSMVFKNQGSINKDSIIAVYKSVSESGVNIKVIDKINLLAYEIHPEDYLKSFEFAKKSLQLAQKINYLRGKAEAMHILGIAYSYSENYTIASEYQDKCIAIGEKIKDNALLARAYNAKGLAKYRQNYFEEAHTFFTDAIGFSEKSKDKYFISAIIHNIAALLDKEGKSQASISYFNQAIKLNEDNNNQLWLSQDYYELAIAQLHLSDYQQAIVTSQKSLTIAEKIGNYRLVVSNMNLMASIAINFDEYEKAEHLLDEAIVIAEKKKFSKIRLEVLGYLSSLYEKQNDFKSAFKNEKKYNRLYDSIYNVDRFKQLDEFRTYYETEQKQKENIDLKKENLSNEIIIQNKNYLIFAFCVLIILTIYLLWLTLKNNKRIDRSNLGLIKQNEAINKQKEELQDLNELKNKFFSIIAHDLRGPLSSLKGMFGIYNNEQLDEKELKTFMNELEKNVNNSASLVENLLMWGKSQMGGEILKIQKINICKLVDETNSLLNEQYKDKKIVLSNHLQFCYAYADEESIRMVIRNLLSNAAKFSPEGGEIFINSKNEGQKLIVSIKDQGMGMDEFQVKEIFKHQFYSTNGTKNEKGSGLGLMLCEEFIKKNKGEFWVESKKGEGSSFFFSLPLKKE
ncbi:MAG: tetratricopeptide repeat-containing sensor histidine kinase [Pelobium sp.]